MDEFIFILELIGTVAFASSGAMIAIEKKMDIFGVNKKDPGKNGRKNSH